MSDDQIPITNVYKQLKAQYFSLHKQALVKTYKRLAACGQHLEKPDQYDKCADAVLSAENVREEEYRKKLDQAADRYVESVRRCKGASECLSRALTKLEGEMGNAFKGHYTTQSGTI